MPTGPERELEESRSRLDRAPRDPDLWQQHLRLATRLGEAAVAAELATLPARAGSRAEELLRTLSEWVLAEPARLRAGGAWCVLGPRGERMLVHQRGSTSLRLRRGASLVAELLDWGDGLVDPGTLTADGRLAVSTRIEDGGVLLRAYSTEDGRLDHQARVRAEAFPRPPELLTSARLAPDGTQLLTFHRAVSNPGYISTGGVLHVTAVDLAAGDHAPPRAIRWSHAGPIRMDMHFSPDSRRVALVGLSGARSDVLRLASLDADEVGAYEFAGPSAQDVAWSPDSRYLAVLERFLDEPTLRVYEDRTATPVARPDPGFAWGLERDDGAAWMAWEHHRGPPDFLGRLAWDVTGRTVFALYPNRPLVVAHVPATPRPPPPRTPPREASPPARVEYLSHPEPILRLTAARVRPRLATFTAAGVARLWDTARRQLLREVEGLAAAPRFSQDGSRVLLHVGDSLRLEVTDSGEPLAEYPPPAAPEAFDLGTCGKVVLLADARGTLHYHGSHGPKRFELTDGPPDAIGMDDRGSYETLLVDRAGGALLEQDVWHPKPPTRWALPEALARVLVPGLRPRPGGARGEWLLPARGGPWVLRPGQDPQPLFRGGSGLAGSMYDSRSRGALRLRERLLDLVAPDTGQVLVSTPYDGPVDPDAGVELSWDATRVRLVGNGLARELTLPPLPEEAPPEPAAAPSRAAAAAPARGRSPLPTTPRVSSAAPHEVSLGLKLRAGLMLGGSWLVGLFLISSALRDPMNGILGLGVLVAGTHHAHQMWTGG